MAIVRRLILALIVGVVWTLPLRAQAPSGVITGRVVDSATRQPVADVNVIVEGTRLGAVTRADGTFLIGGVPVGVQTVRARRIGYGSPQQSVTIVPNGTATVEFSLERRVAILEEVVTTGYGTQRRVAITGSISTIDPDAANVGVSPNVNSLIQGRAAGVYMAQNSGEPGANAQIRIRGGTSVSASNEPLYVVDGVPIVTGDVDPNGMGLDGTPPLPRSPLNLINPADIESISILKDASASIYGTRAANGVILITTKKGSGTGPGIEYEFYVGRSSSPRSLDLLDGDQYRTFVTEQVAIKTACLAAPPAGPGTIAERCAPVGLNATALAAQGTANTDWEGELTRSANTINQNLSFAGGAGNTQYRASLNYMDQQGIVLANGFKRYQARVNGAHQAFSGRLRLGLNLTGSQIRNDYLTFENTGGFEGGVFINMVNYNPTLPVTRVDAISGETLYFEVPGQVSVRNPVALAEQLLDFGTTTLALGNVSADLDILSNLTGTVNVGVNRTDATRGQYWPRANPVGSITSGRALQEQRDNTLTNLSTVLTYRPEFSDKHSVDLLGGYEFSEYTRSEFGAEARNFLTDAFGYNRLQSGGTLLPPTSYREESRIVGFFSRLNYSLLDKYFLTATIRRDGSSRFGEGNKWAVFPAVSASWRISQEGFGLGPVSELRLRAGWGRLGNPAVPPYASLLLLSAEASSRYGFGDVPTTGVAPIRNPNPNLKWEQTDLTNVALDYGFMDNRFTGSLEYYSKKTTDLIFEVPVPQPAVVATRLENIGSMTNKGIEFSLDALVMNRPEFTWNAGLVFSRDRNELGANTFVTTGGISGQGQSGNQSQRILPGQPLGTFFGPQFVGINAAGQELFACASQGAADTACVNGQMTRATPLRSSDYRIIGDANPSFTVGLRSLVNWRKFDLSFLINSQQGLDVFNNTALVYATKNSARSNKNFLESALNDGVRIDQAPTYSSRWIEDGSFIRMQNVTLGYTFDRLPFLGPARGTRVYLSGDNLFLITDYSGYDPEVHTQSGLASRGIDYLHYPRARTITGGIRVAF